MEDEEIKWVLEENREEIVRDLQPRFILKDLEASGAIDAKEVNLISVEVFALNFFGAEYKPTVQDNHIYA